MRYLHSFTFSYIINGPKKALCFEQFKRHAARGEKRTYTVTSTALLCVYFRFDPSGKALDSISCSPDPFPNYWHLQPFLPGMSKVTQKR